MGTGPMLLGAFYQIESTDILKETYHTQNSIINCQEREKMRQKQKNYQQQKLSLRLYISNAFDTSIEACYKNSYPIWECRIKNLISTSKAISRKQAFSKGICTVLLPIFFLSYPQGRTVSAGHRIQRSPCEQKLFKKSTRRIIV
jgi:hypothetical protein